MEIITTHNPLVIVVIGGIIGAVALAVGLWRAWRDWQTFEDVEGVIVQIVTAMGVGVFVYAIACVLYYTGVIAALS